MEEMIVSAVIGELASRFISFLIDTCSKLLMAPPVTSREESLARLRALLLRICAVVEDAEGRRITNHAMLQQLDALRQAMHRGHLTLDTIRCHLLPQDPTLRCDSAFAIGVVMRTVRAGEMPSVSSSAWKPLFKMQLSSFSSWENTCLVSLGSPTACTCSSKSACSALEMERVIDFLLQGSGARDHPAAAEHLGVLPIVGPAYVGKSTLVEHACIDERVRSHFAQILFLSAGDLGDEHALNNLADGGVGVIKHENIAAAGGDRGRGRVMIILELDSEISEELWRRLYSVAKNCFARSSKIIVTSRSDHVVRFGTTLPLRLRFLAQEAYWYYFKVRSFGSVDMATEHPKLTSIAMEMAGEMSGCFMGGTIFGGMMRSKLDVGTWSLALATYRAFRQMNSFLSAPNPVDPWALTRPILLPTPNRRSPGCVIVTGVAFGHGDSAAPPKVSVQDVMLGSARPRGNHFFTGCCGALSAGAGGSVATGAAAPAALALTGAFSLPSVFFSASPPASLPSFVSSLLAPLPSFMASLLLSFFFSSSFSGGGTMCGGGVCLSFMSICRMRERSVALPGLGPCTTTMPGFRSCSFLLPLFSSPGISCGTSSAIAFQYCRSASLWNFSWFARDSCWFSTEHRSGRIIICIISSFTKYFVSQLSLRFSRKDFLNSSASAMISSRRSLSFRSFSSSINAFWLQIKIKPSNDDPIPFRPRNVTRADSKMNHSPAPLSAEDAFLPHALRRRQDRPVVGRRTEQVLIEAATTTDAPKSQAAVRRAVHHIHGAHDMLHAVRRVLSVRVRRGAVGAQRHAEAAVHTGVARGAAQVVLGDGGAEGGVGRGEAVATAHAEDLLPATVLGGGDIDGRVEGGCR
ncbi:LOW QUALITY PROTEIN: hypothetical protein U9M48_012717 [Paspalum notatum var. saurae]|uniref:NB-ARC domain-containing protein n=1 Tax=Paspalum notatum var. saurae TaxID=547442 RepID=A0AAQ3SYF7_PASNO